MDGWEKGRLPEAQKVEERREEKRYRRRVALGPVVLGLLSVAALIGASLWLRTMPHITVHDAAMAPAVPRGAAVFVEPSDHYLLGDLVVVQLPEGKLVRRIHDNPIGGYTTKADHPNAVPDHRPLAKEQIVGRVKLTVPVLGNILSIDALKAEANDPQNRIRGFWLAFAALLTFGLMNASSSAQSRSQRRHRRQYRAASAAHETASQTAGTN